jgi:hypothetical protein
LIRGRDFRRALIATVNGQVYQRGRTAIRRQKRIHQRRPTRGRRRFGLLDAAEANPVIASAGGVVAVDALTIVRGRVGE